MVMIIVNVSSVFGETAMARRPEGTTQVRKSSKSEGQWRVGVWLGKLDEPDEHLLWDGEELIRCRPCAAVYPRGPSEVEPLVAEHSEGDTMGSYGAWLRRN